MKVIISGGGTGGHIFPAIAIANAIKKRYPEADILFVGAEPIIAIFRDDPDVLAVGVRALRLQAVAILALPVSVACEMLYQSCGHRGGATLLSGIRNGILFIPLLLILSSVRGLAGIQEAQPLAYVLSLPICIPFIIRFFRQNH